jgi:putative addiction module killer protein
MYSIHVYQTEDGLQPFLAWREPIKTLQTAVVIDNRIDRITLGLLGDCKSVGNGVHELRIDYGPGYRVYFAFDGARMILLLCGGDKKTQPADIAKAKEYFKDYRRRKN